MSHVRPLLGAALSAAVLISAGCGSSSDGGGAQAAKPKAAAAVPAATTPAAAAVAPQTGPRPSKTAYVRRADKVCRAAREVSRSANAVVQKAFQSGDGARAADAIDNYMPMFNRQMAELKALRQPAVDAQILGGLLKVMDGQVQALRDESSALRQQDRAALQRIGQAQQQELQFAEELGRQYGFRVCGRSA